MRLEEILRLNVSEIPNKPVGFTSQDLHAELKELTAIYESRFAAGGALFNRIDLLAKSQDQQDRLTFLANSFLGRVQNVFDQKQG